MSAINDFLFVMERNKNDRGLMADLRHGFSLGTEYRAWPHLAKWCNLENEKSRRIWLTIAAGFATHQASLKNGNLGFSLRLLALEGKFSNDRDDQALIAYDARFRRLLSCQTAVELCNHLPGIIKLAANKGIGINYEQLFWDLLFWDNHEKGIKIRWASSYWSGPKNSLEGEAASDNHADIVG